MPGRLEVSRATNDSSITYYSTQKLLDFFIYSEKINLITFILNYCGVTLYSRQKVLIFLHNIR